MAGGGSGHSTPHGGNSPREPAASAAAPAAPTDESARDPHERYVPDGLHALEELLDCGFFYFSFELDLTVTLQKTVKCAATMPWWRDMPLWDRAERRFLWNQHMMRPLEAAGAYPFMLPIMYGFVQVPCTCRSTACMCVVCHMLNRACGIEHAVCCAACCVLRGMLYGARHAGAHRRSCYGRLVRCWLLCGSICHSALALQRVFCLNSSSVLFGLCVFCFQIVEGCLLNSRFRLALISRRSKHRAGVRFIMRGIDESGYSSRSR